MLFARIDAHMLHMRYLKWQYFIRGVQKTIKCNNYIKFRENEEMQNDKKTNGEINISKRSTVVVGKARLASQASPQPEAKNDKNVIPTLGGSNRRREDVITIIIYMK